MHPTTSAALAEQRRSEMRAAADHRRIVRAARAARPARTPLLAALVSRFTRSTSTSTSASTSTSTVRPATTPAPAPVPTPAPAPQVRDEAALAGCR